MEWIELWGEKCKDQMVSGSPTCPRANFNVGNWTILIGTLNFLLPCKIIGGHQTPALPFSRLQFRQISQLCFQAANLRIESFISWSNQLQLQSSHKVQERGTTTAAARHQYCWEATHEPNLIIAFDWMHRNFFSLSSAKEKTHCLVTFFISRLRWPIILIDASNSRSSSKHIHCQASRSSTEEKKIK